jgi:hypothetical protein
MASGSTAMCRRAAQTCSCQASAEHFQQCAEFLKSRPWCARRDGIARSACRKGYCYTHAHLLSDQPASSEDFEAQQRLVTPVPFDVVTRGAEGTRFEFRHSPGAHLSKS